MNLSVSILFISDLYKMKITSTITTVNRVLFEIDTLSLHEQDLEIKSCYSNLPGSIRAECLFLSNRNFVVMHNQLHTSKNLTDQFSCAGNVYFITMLVRGRAQTKPTSDGQAECSYSPLNQDKLFISCEQQIANVIAMENGEHIEYYGIVIDKDFLKDLVEKHGISGQSGGMLRNLDLFRNFDQPIVGINDQIKTVIELLFQPTFRTPHYLHYLHLKFIELLLLLENQLLIASHTIAEDEISTMTQEVHDWIRGSYMADFTVAKLSKQFGINTMKLNQEFKLLTGQTIRSFVIDLKMKKSKILLAEEKLPIYEVSELVGYKSSSHFVQTFKSHFGITPKQYVLNQM